MEFSKIKATTCWKFNLSDYKLITNYIYFISLNLTDDDGAEKTSKSLKLRAFSQREEPAPSQVVNSLSQPAGAYSQASGYY